MDRETRERFYGALERYNRGDYLACQEDLEAVYGQTSEETQPLVRALLLLACGVHLHFRRGGGRGATNLMRQCLLGLEDFRPRHLGIEVDELYEAVAAYIEDIKARRRSGANFFDRWLAPRIRYVTE